LSLDRVFYLKTEMTIFTGSKHALWYLKMVVLTFLNNKFSWTYMLIIYCCHGNSTQLKKKNQRYYLSKRVKCPTIKTPLEGLFCCCLIYPNYS
jgi:hypothetical protein